MANMEALIRVCHREEVGCSLVFARGDAARAMLPGDAIREPLGLRVGGAVFLRALIDKMDPEMIETSRGGVAALINALPEETRNPRPLKRGL